VQRALDEAKLRKLQQASEHALQASELRFRELADAIPQLVWATDATGKIKYCNGRARSYAGERAESGDVPGIEICHVDDRPNLKRIWQRSIETGSPASTEYRLRQAKDGAYRWHLAQFVPLHDGSSKVEGWVVTAVEVEEQKRREQALLESERALLRATETLEQRVEERTAAYSRLSARLLTIQDDERRKIARDLHDGFGQTLVALKTNLDTLHDLADGLPEERRLQMQAECGQLLEDCLSEVRTISYLLHPPLLDESGLALAARWYVNGFSERSGIETRLDLPSDMERLPAEVETVLFRVLQAALSNVHRHAGARQVDVKLTVDTTRVQMRIRDYGVGIPEDKLRAFRKGGFDVGVGLAGMRERVRDLNGSLEVTSNGGTTVAVTIPVQGCRAGETTTRQPLLA
jgi:PAS domain S-box-containing protein